MTVSVIRVNVKIIKKN